MAKIIKCNHNNEYVKLVLTDAHEAAQHYNPEHHTAEVIDDAVANAIISGTKTVNLGVIEDTEVYAAGIDRAGEPVNACYTKEEFDQKRERINQVINIYKEVNQKNAMYNEIVAYQTALNAVDSSAITFPISQTVEAYMQSQGITVYHPLQIP